ncbi:MAG: peptidase M19 [Nevskiaceae bacterium]|nr:MAG: peptidase M19 [Nevskiaceae bacterium]
MRHSGLLLSALGASLLLAACGRSSGPAASAGIGGNGVLPPGAVPTTRYDLANGCYALQALKTGQFAVKGSDGSYTASAGNPDTGEPFFMKPTALGKYLFYTHDQSFMSAANSPVGTDGAPSDAADWTIDTADAGHSFSVFSASANKSLAVDPSSGKLVLADAASDATRFHFSAAKGCTPYPEAQVNAVGDTFKGEGIDKPVLGFADVHQHISATTFLGGAHYGSPFHRFGVTEALKDCSGVHGPDGHLDLLGNLYATQPLATHDTVGWPTFNAWPAPHSLTHESTYYKWIERAWKAGLRILLNNLVENATLCHLEVVAHGNPTQDCNEMDSAVSQAQFMHDMQDYIDAQEGGPGKGWFRLVDNPADARKVINQGKLAVVLGIEISHLFNCNLTQVAGLADVSGCTTADIDTQFDRLYQLGVREMFPIHEFDNALGGNGIFDGLVLNVGNFVDTGSFWKTYDCPSTDPSGNFGDYLYTPGAKMTTSDPSGVTAPANPVVSALLAGKTIPLPIYPTTRQCNARGLTDLGKYAFKKMMDHKIIMEVDHLELSMKEDLIKLAEQQNPPYPLISSHGGHGGISNDQAARIYKLGGVVYPGGGGGTGPQWYDFVTKLLPLSDPNHLFGVGLGSDTNGLAAQPEASGLKPGVQYPFTLFRGKDWGPQFARLSPIQFDKQVTGQHVYDLNVEGRAHYGLDADWVEEIRLGAIAETQKWNADPAHKDQQRDPDQQAQLALSALYNSAEAYLRLWEATVNR